MVTRPEAPGDGTRRPDPGTAMRGLIAQARALLDHAGDAASACAGDCGDCLAKQLEGFAQLLADWEARLADGEQPSLGALHRFGRDATALRASLARHGLPHAMEPSGRASAWPSLRGAEEA